MGVRNIKKQLAGVEDLLLGEGTQVQERNSGSVPITKINLVGIVDTVEDLATLDVTKYTTAIVKDLDRGGTFEWSATGTANGGTVFAGATGYWNRQYSGAVNIKWFGAVGDGITDDTLAIQSCFTAFNKDYLQPFSFPFFGNAQKLGGHPKLVFGNGSEAFAISDTLILSTNMEVDFNGCTLIMLPAGVGKDMIKYMYNFDAGSVDGYGTFYCSGKNLYLNGNGYARNGLILNLITSSKFDNISVINCTSVGFLMEECQYTTFNHLTSDNCSIGLKLTNTVAQPNLRCVDLTFTGCSFVRNGVGILIDNASHCTFYHSDISRNSVSGIHLKNSTTGGTTVNRNIIFNSAKVEYTADDEPSSGAFLIIEGNSNENKFIDFAIEQQFGSVITRRAYFKWCRNASVRNELIRWVNMSDNLLSENPLIAGDYTIFSSVNYNGLYVDFGQTRLADIANIRKLATYNEATGALCLAGDGRCMIKGRTQLIESINYQQLLNTDINTVSALDVRYTSVSTNPSLRITKTGGIVFGNTTSDIATMPSISNYATDYMKFSGKVLIGDNAYNSGNMVWFGSYQLWFDTTGNMRFKKFGQTGDTSGTLLGGPDGKSGTFTSADGKTITVTNGLITNIV